MIIFLNFNLSFNQSSLLNMKQKHKLFLSFLTYPVHTKPHYDIKLTYELSLGHHELIMRFCVDWVSFNKLSLHNRKQNQIIS